MIGRQVDKLRESLAEATGVHADDLVLAYRGPDFRIWAIAAAVVGGVVFAVIGLAGAVGGAIVGGVIGAWFLVAKPYSVAVDGDASYLVRMSQPLAGSARPEEVLSRDPLGVGVVSREGSKLRYGDLELQLLMFWRARADEVVRAASLPSGAPR